MAQGLLAGGLFTAIFSLVFAILSMIAPLSAWLTTRTEVYNDICLYGEGMWSTGFWSGTTVLGIAGFKHSCSSFPRNDDLVIDGTLGNLSSSDAYALYCQGEDQDPDMCSYIKWARICHISNIVFLCLVLLGGILCHTRLKGVEEMWPALLASISGVLSVAASISTFVLMFTSPLFSQEHFDYLTKVFNMHVPFEGMGCKYQSPFQAKHFILSIIHNAALECVLPGPGFALGLGILVFSALSTACFAYLFIDFHKVRNRESSAANRPLLATLLPRSDTGNSITEEAAMHNQIMQPRRYSLYGASLRHNEGCSWFMKRVIATIIPILLLIMATMFAIWMVDGLRFAVTVDVDLYDFLIDPRSLNGDMMATEINKILHAMTERVAEMGVSINPDDIEEAAKTIEKNFIDGLAEVDNWNDEKKVHLLTLVQSVFDFMPLTTTTDFWQAGAHLQTAVTLVCCYFFPFFRLFVWMYLWYLPCDELIRGRALSWMDALGKIAVANIFCLSLFATGFVFDGVINIPILIAKVWVNVKVDLIPGYGTWGFIVPVFLTNMLGEFLIFFHGKATRWEELRRSGLVSEKKTAKTGRLLRVLSRRSSSLLDFGILDTPYLDDGRGAFDLNTGGRSVESTPRSSASASSTGRGRTDTLDTTDDTVGGRRPSRPRKYSSVWSHLNTLDANEVVPMVYDYPQSLCNTTHTPVRGRYHTFSCLGKSLISFSLVAALACTLVGQYSNSFLFKREGVIGDLLVPSEHKHEAYSMGTIADGVSGCGGPHGKRAYGLATTLFIFAIIMPIVHLVSLCILWFAPLRLEGFTRLFRLVETFAAWNALDVFLISIVACWTDLPTVSKQIIPVVVPKLNDYAKNYFHDELFLVTPSLLNGFWWLLLGVMIEKILTVFIVPLAATKIAERKLDRLSMQNNTISEEEEYTYTEGDENGGENNMNTGSNDVLSGIQAEDDYGRLLEIMTPTSRYVGVSGMPKVVYAGFPRWTWRLGIKAGLLIDVTDN